MHCSEMTHRPRLKNMWSYHIFHPSLVIPNKQFHISIHHLLCPQSPTLFSNFSSFHINITFQIKVPNKAINFTTVLQLPVFTFPYAISPPHFTFLTN